MKNTALLTPITQQLDLIVVEYKQLIENKFHKNFQNLFKSVTYIHSQKEALEAIEKSVDILILDIELNDLESGFGFINHIKRINPFIKIVVYSYNIEQAVLLKCIKYSVAGFLYNESDEYDLKDTIQTCVERIFLTIHNKLTDQFNKDLTIKDCFDFLVLKGSLITLVSHHQHIPLARIAHIIEYDEDSIVLKVDSIQLKTLEKDSHAVLCSMHLGVELFVTVSNIDFASSIVTFFHTNYIESYVHHRKTPRVAPKAGSYITLVEDNIHAYILNISIDHVLCKDNSRLSSFRLYTNFNFLINCKIDSSISHQLDYQIKANGYIKETISSHDGKKVLIKFEISPEDREILKNYINHKTVEVIKNFRNELLKK